MFGVGSLFGFRRTLVNPFSGIQGWSESEVEGHCSCEQLQEPGRVCGACSLGCWRAPGWLVVDQGCALLSCGQLSQTHAPASQACGLTSWDP